MIRLRSITLSRGGKELLSQAEAVIAPGERIALVGPNGSGKSSLLAALVGDGVLDSGSIDLPPMRIVRLEQDVPGSQMPAWQFVEAADQALINARARMAQAQASGDGLQIAHCHEALLECGESNSHSRVKELLAGLGFSEAQSEQPVQALSLIHI